MSFFVCILFDCKGNLHFTSGDCKFLWVAGFRAWSAHPNFKLKKHCKRWILDFLLKTLFWAGKNNTGCILFYIWVKIYVLGIAIRSSEVYDIQMIIYLPAHVAQAFKTTQQSYYSFIKLNPWQFIPQNLFLAKNPKTRPQISNLNFKG